MAEPFLGQDDPAQDRIWRLPAYGCGNAPFDKVDDLEAAPRKNPVAR